MQPLGGNCCLFSIKQQRNYFEEFGTNFELFVINNKETRFKKKGQP